MMSEFTVDEISKAWYDILSQYVIAKMALQKQIDQLLIENEDLKTKLHQSELNLISSQAKSVIDGE